MADANGRLAGKVAILTGAGSRAGGIGNGGRHLIRGETRWVTGIGLPVDASTSAAPSPCPSRRGGNAAH